MSDQIENAEEESNISLLVDIIASNIEDEDVMDEVLSAAYRVCVSKSDFDGVATTKFCDSMGACLDKWWEEPSLLEMIFGCMRCFAGKNVDMQAKLCTDSIVGLVVKCLGTHIDGEETVQEQGCLVIEALARGNSANVDILKNPEFKIGDVLTQAHELITNERNKKYPLQARDALGL